MINETAIKGRAVRDACEVYLGISPEVPTCKLRVRWTQVKHTYKRVWWTLWLCKRLTHTDKRVSTRWYVQPIVNCTDQTRSDAAKKVWNFEPWTLKNGEEMLAFKVEFLGTVVREEDLTCKSMVEGDTLTTSYTLSGNSA